MTIIHKRQRIVAIGVLITLIFIVYGQVFHFDFVNIDDPLYVTQNAHIKNGFSIEGIVWAFNSIHAANWHPLTSLSLMIDHDLYGLNAGGYHFTNLVLHIFNALLLFLIINKTTGTVYRSFFVAALFGLHPLHVESVAWISERKDVLSTFFVFIAIGFYVFYALRPTLTRYLPIFLFFALGLMSKPMVVTLPFVMLLLDFWPLNRFPASPGETFRDIGQRWNFSIEPIKNLVVEKIPLFILSLTSCIITYLVQKHSGAVATMDIFPLDERVGNAVVSYIRYIENTLLPLQLSVFYPHPGMWPIGQVILAGCAIAALTYVFWKKSKRYPYLLTGWFWYLGTLVPVIGIVQAGSQSMADRYTYIPLIGLSIVLAWGAPDLLRRIRYKQWVLSAGAILIIAVLSVLSWQRCQLWGDSYALWNDALKNHPVAYAYYYRGLVSAQKGQYDEALRNYNAALKINSKYVLALNNRALAYEALGQYANALKDYEQALRLYPRFTDAYYNRGCLHLQNHQLDAAVSDFTQAIRLDASMADAFNNRGIAFGLKGLYERSLADFNQALKLNRNFAQAYLNRGNLYQLTGRYDRAAGDFAEAIRIDPHDQKAQKALREIDRIRMKR